MRPQLDEHKDPLSYLNAMLAWRKEFEKGFSIRKACKDARRCSPALVTLVLAGKKKLMPDRVGDFTAICGLTPNEATAFCTRFGFESAPRLVKPPVGPRIPVKANNHLLSNWLHLYIKDMCRLKSFADDPAVIAKQLGGLASEAQVKRSLQFLLHHGYLKRNQKGALVENEGFTETTEEIPSADIRAFHKRALLMTADNIERVSVNERDAYALVLPLNASSFVELKQLLKDFQMRLAEFADSHQKDNEALYQVVMHLTPIAKEQK